MSNRRQTGEAFWFAWRPVRLEGGGWAWLRTVKRKRWMDRYDVYTHEWSSYALLP